MHSKPEPKWRYSDVTVVVIDESVGREEQDKALRLVLQRGVCNPAVVNVKESYSGLADEQILASLLGSNTVLVTRDRPFHNTVLARGFRSLCIQGDNATDRPLPGIRPKEMPVSRKPEELEEGTLYHPPAVALRTLLLPASERELKTLTTRRRRIRNHFGGLQNLSAVAVTVSWLGDLKVFCWECDCGSPPPTVWRPSMQVRATCWRSAQLEKHLRRRFVTGW